MVYNKAIHKVEEWHFDNTIHFVVREIKNHNMVESHGKCWYSETEQNLYPVVNRFDCRQAHRLSSVLFIVVFVSLVG
jgi:hypothetical protein